MEKEKILFLGLPRTGTLSLYEAVKQLGYNPFHGVVTLGKPEMFTQFDQALTAKFEGRGRKWGAEEWSMFLADYDCILLDMISIFADDLLSAFPSAKVVIVNRDFASWYASCQNSLLYTTSWQSWPLVMWSNPFTNGLLRFCRHYLRVIDGRNPETAERYHRDWYEMVRRLAAERKGKHGRAVVLEYHVRDGWEPLCEFLGVEVPNDQAFPRVNNSKELRDAWVKAWRMSAMLAILKVAGSLLPIVAAGAAVKYYLSKLR